MWTLSDLAATTFARAGPPVGTALVGVPWEAVVAVTFAGLGLSYAWQVFQRPDLVERWLDIAERRRERKQSRCGSRRRTR